MTNRIPLNITELNFDAIKQSLIEFLRSKDSPIKDYAYEGSTFNILLDVLAANTHYNAIYSNFVSNEMYLDSALMRSSIVSIAKELGYVPRSAKASVATINVSIAPLVPGNTVITIPANSKFNTNVNDTVYNYYNTDDVFLEWSDEAQAYTGQFDVICGDLYTQEIPYTEGSPIYIEADGVDISTLTVQVQNSSMDLTNKVYTYFNKILDLNSESIVYFLTETDLQRYEVRFGDGVLGKKLQTGNIVKLRYIAADLEAPFGATNFLPNSDLYPGFTVTVSNVVPSSVAAAIETTESIKQNVQRYNQAQERSVISGDYEYHIQQDFPEVRSVIVWGGEENNPPQYGKVFASCIINELTSIPTSKKLKIAEGIKKRSTINIRPVIVDPEYIDIIVHGFVRFKADRIGITANELKSRVVESIKQFSNENLKRFNATLSFSNLSSEINKIDDAVSSVVFGFKLSHNMRIESDIPLYVTKRFRNAISKESFISTKYFKNGDTGTSYEIADDEGILKEYSFLDNLEANRAFSRAVGTIDYATGDVTFENIFGEPIDGSTNLNVSFDVDSTEIESGFNQVLSIDDKKSGVRIEVRAQ